MNMYECRYRGWFRGGFPWGSVRGLWGWLTKNFAPYPAISSKKVLSVENHLLIFAA